MFENIGGAETLERAVELIGYGKELPEDEAIGVAVGWWPSFGIASGAYVKINGDGSGTIITGAQECGTGAVMALPLLAAEVLGMRPDDFSILYQDTDAGPFDSGASGSQTTFNNGRAVQRAARDVREQLLDLAAEELEANRDDLELRDGAVSVKGSPTKSVTIPALAEKAHGGNLLLGRGADDVPAMPECDASGCTGRLGMESFLAPTFITHAVRCKVDRETEFPKASQGLADAAAFLKKFLDENPTHAMALEAEQSRLQRRIADVAVALADGEAELPDPELKRLAHQLKATRRSLLGLRALLDALRVRAEAARAA